MFSTGTLIQKLVNSKGKGKNLYENASIWRRICNFEIPKYKYNCMFFKLFVVRQDRELYLDMFWFIVSNTGESTPGNKNKFRSILSRFMKSSIKRSTSRRRKQVERCRKLTTKVLMEKRFNVTTKVYNVRYSEYTGVVKDIAKIQHC
jgi:hypothetical protein